MAKLGKIWASIIKNAVNIIKNIVSSKIEDPLAKAAWLKTLEPTDKIIDALSDKNPDDKKQISSIVKEHTNMELIPFAEGFALDKINLIQKEDLRNFIIVLSQPVFAAGKLSTDSNPDDQKQISDYTEAWIEDPHNQKQMVNFLFLPLLKQATNNPLMLNIVMEQINEVLGKINIDINGDGV